MQEFKMVKCHQRLIRFHQKLHPSLNLKLLATLLKSNVKMLVIYIILYSTNMLYSKSYTVILYIFLIPTSPFTIVTSLYSMQSYLKNITICLH